MAIWTVQMGGSYLGMGCMGMVDITIKWDNPDGPDTLVHWAREFMGFIGLKNAAHTL